MTIWTLKCPIPLVNAVHSGRLPASATKHEFRLTLTNRQIETIPTETMNALARWEWPGNVREYLFSCGVMWHKQRDASAGRELIQFLRSQDKGTRAIAAALLAKTEHARLLVRDLRRARVHVAKPATRNVGCRDGRGPSKVAEMNTPYGLEIVESCLTRKLRKQHWFCGLSAEVLKMLSAVSHLST